MILALNPFRLPPCYSVSQVFSLHYGKIILCLLWFCYFTVADVLFYRKRVLFFAIPWNPLSCLCKNWKATLLARSTCHLKGNICSLLLPLPIAVSHLVVVWFPHHSSDHVHQIWGMLSSTFTFSALTCSSWRKCLYGESCLSTQEGA